jgi:plasmid stabilization system protein ParE
MGKVKWSNEAREDLEEFYLQYCQFSEKFALKWADGIFEVTHLL